MNIKNLEGKSALDLFPGLLRKALDKEESSCSIPPPPPDISWLKKGLAQKETTRTGSSALIALTTDKKRAVVTKVLEGMGYIVDLAESAAHARQLLQAVDYNLVVCGTGAVFKEVHRYICSFPAVRRRMTYYTLVGPNLHTLYDLEALAFSANLVVNDRDLPYFERILTKGIRDFEKLFGPLIDILGFDDSSRL